MNCGTVYIQKVSVDKIKPLCNNSLYGVGISSGKSHRL